MNITQNWTYTNKYPKGSPIFFVDGKRVSLKKGFDLTLDGELGDAQYLKTWFAENGFIDSSRVFAHRKPKMNEQMPEGKYVVWSALLGEDEA